VITSTIGRAVRGIAVVPVTVEADIPMAGSAHRYDGLFMSQVAGTRPSMVTVQVQPGASIAITSRPPAAYVRVPLPESPGA
jgi:hypothetical protein